MEHANVEYLDWHRPRPVAPWTPSDHQLLLRLAARMDTHVEFGAADDGAPWAALGDFYSVARETPGRVVVLDPEGNLVADGPTLDWALRAFETTWWSRSKTA